MDCVASFIAVGLPITYNSNWTDPENFRVEMDVIIE